MHIKTSYSPEAIKALEEAHKKIGKLEVKVSYSEKEKEDDYDLQERVKFLEESNCRLHNELSNFNRTIILDALREIDTHIRATSDPLPYIIKTLKETLPEYRE